MGRSVMTRGQEEVFIGNQAIEMAKKLREMTEDTCIHIRLLEAAVRLEVYKEINKDLLDELIDIKNTCADFVDKLEALLVDEILKEEE